MVRKCNKNLLFEYRTSTFFPTVSLEDRSKAKLIKRKTKHFL